MAKKIMRRGSSDRKYGMKAAPLYPEQLADRIGKFNALGIDPLIELHLFGGKDVFDPGVVKKMIENCNKYKAEYYVHFPVQDADGFGVFDPAIHPDAYFEEVLNFSRSIGAKGMIMHRIYGIDMPDNKENAVKDFNARLIKWGEKAHPLAIYLENYSFIWLPKEFKQEYVVSPLDHFFPWEMAETIKLIKDNNIRNIFVMVDIAHAVITSNMFNLLKSRSSLKNDPRFSNISSQDLAQTDQLSPKDFLVKGIAPYFHVSDSFVWRQRDGLNDLHKYMCSEGLPIGKGNIDFTDLFGNLANGAVMIMEIFPEDGDHANNKSQLKAIEWFKICEN